MAKMAIPWMVLVALLLSSFLISTGTCENCSLSDTWNGEWFIAEFANGPPIVINSSTNSINGRPFEGHGQLGDCIWMDEDFYAFRNHALNCTKCILLNVRHKNVLYSRESLDCFNDVEWGNLENPMQSCRGLIESHDNEDRYFWFRKDYKSIDCPLGGESFKFSYTRDHGTKCEIPVSHASSCLDSTKLRLHYEGCHDNPKSSGHAQELTCVATWEETGAYGYFVADVKPVQNQKNPRSLQDRYRCFTYSTETVHSPLNGRPPIVTGHYLGTSEMATCNGLANPIDAETILYLDKGIPNLTEVEHNCKFPSWLAAHKWLDMKKSVELILYQQEKNRSARIMNSHDAPNERTDERRTGFFPLASSSLVCLQTQNVSSYSEITQYSQSQVAVIAKYTKGCKIDEICLHLIQRSDHVFQFYYLERLEMNKHIFRAKCFDSPTEELHKGATMISTYGTKEKKKCPYPGKYLPIQPIDTDFLASLNISSFSSELEWSIDCNNENLEDSLFGEPKVLTPLSCLDGWSEGDTNVTIMYSKSFNNETSKLYCMKSSKTVFSEAESHRDSDILITSQDCIYSKNDTSIFGTIESTDPLNNYSAAKLTRTALCSSDSGGLLTGETSESNTDSFTSSSTTSLVTSKPVNFIMKVILELLILLFFYCNVI